MKWQTIRKPDQPDANLIDYERTCQEFSWESARSALDGLLGGRGLNIAHEAVDRHAAGPLADKVALRCVDKHDAVTEISYAELSERTNRFANLLRELGVERGQRVFTLLGRVPDLYVAVLGTLKAGCVLSPLFSAFGPEPIRQRLALGEGAVLVTTPALYRRKVRGIRDELPSLGHVLLTGDGDDELGALTLGPLLSSASPEFTVEPTAPDEPALLHFTSGTTGTPKGAVHVHEAVLAHHVTAAYALDLHTEDIFWYTADPGWVTGMSYGVIAPLTHGATLVSDEGDFDAARWYRVLASQRVSVWYTAPTALRLDRAQLGSWLNGLPDGLDTALGAHGTPISGGERQRLAVARALLPDRPILLLDEPTAHLDAPTAAALASDILAAAQDKTTIVVTHRPAEFAGLTSVALDNP